MAGPYRNGLAALTVGLFAAGAAHSAEMLVMPPGAQPLSRAPMTTPQDWAYYPRKMSSYAHDGLLVSFPVELSSLVCYPGLSRTLFEVKTLEYSPTFPDNDPRGLSRLALRYAGQDGVLSLEATVQPIIDGRRISVPQTYEFKILDRFAAPGAFCGKSAEASAFQFNLYLNPSSLVIEAVPLMGGIAPVYLSPINMGLGDYLWSAVTEASGLTQMSGDAGAALLKVVTASNSEVRLYGLNWTSKNSADHPFDRGLYNVKDSLNYQFGAKAYPTASPTLTLPRAAAALLTTP